MTSPIWRKERGYMLPVLRVDGYLATIHPIGDDLYEYFADDDAGNSGWAASGNALTEQDARHAAAEAITNHIYMLAELGGEQ